MGSTGNADKLISKQDVEAARSILKNSIDPNRLEQAQQTIRLYKKQNNLSDIPRKQRQRVSRRTSTSKYSRYRW